MILFDLDSFISNLHVLVPIIWFTTVLILILISMTVDNSKDLTQVNYLNPLILV